MFFCDRIEKVENLFLFNKSSLAFICVELLKKENVIWFDFSIG